MIESQFIATKLNLDSHYSLLSDKDLVYLLNGDIQGKEGNVDYFVQNAPSNELCINTTGYTLIGPGIALNNFEHVLFLKGEGTDWIWKANLKDCTYEVWASGDCLNFDPNYPIRGEYKHNNKNNDRRVYFIDGKNHNRYIDIDKDFPQNYTGSTCESCEIIYDGTLNCDQIKINKMLEYPCLDMSANNLGSLPSGVYQVALAYSTDGIKYSDFYYSDVIKVHSERENIGLQVEISCVDSLFDQYKLILVTNTRNSALVVYDLGFYSSTTTSVGISTLVNAPVLSTSQALEKRVVYDKSQHITTNGETLLIGKHAKVEPLDYQRQAIDIRLYWAEGKVPKKDAHKYPSLLRDENVAFAIEWFDEVGQSRGIFNIPGAHNDSFSIEFESVSYGETDTVPEGAYVYELENCEPKSLQVWQVENTSTLIQDLSATCEVCEDLPTFSKYGRLGYYECESLTYPNEERWGDLACQPIRHHRMPSSNLSHIHNQGTCVTSEMIINDYDEEGIPVEEVSYTTEYVEDDCINILGIIANNISFPKDSDGNDITNWKYRILYSKRGNIGDKSILHKGLIFNTFQEIINPGADQEVIYYPNYPYNDLKSDVFISKTQTGHQDDVQNFTPNGYISNSKFTYHSPDIHYKETKNEFGIELKLYTEEIGKIEGEFNPVYNHPQTAIDASGPNLRSAWQYARQFDSVANYSSFEAVALPFENRRLITDSQFLLPIRQFVEDTTRFNNYFRENSYFFSADDSLQIPVTNNEDTSRFLTSEIGCQTKVKQCAQISRSGTDYDIQAVSYYVGIKNPQLNQYGSLEQITYLPLEHCLRETDGTDTLDLTNIWWGGDTYISKHTIARKMPLFTEWLDDVPFDSAEYNYRDKRNVYYPRFWYDTISEADDKYRFDCFVSRGDFNGSNSEVGGYFYIWINGVLDFWCESEFIGNFREEDSTPNSRFFPTTEPKELFRADTIRLQPSFLYDLSLLGEDIDQKKQTLNLTDSDADFVVIYSLKNDFQSAGDNWLTFLPLNYTILPRIYGEFTCMHYTDQYSILFGFENQMLYSQEDYTQTTNEGNTLFLQQGDIFSRRLRKMSNEKTGYTGCVDPLSLVNTRHGTFYYDRYRKTWFNWAGKLTPIEDNHSWFTQFTSNINPGYLNSIVSVYDNYSKNLYITDKVNQWTLSYKPQVGFVSFHSFVPDWYISLPNTFLSAPEGAGAGIWKHNAQFDYQSYYGTVYPFDIGFIIKGVDQKLQSFEFYSDWIKHENYASPIFVKDKFFDSILVYSDQTSTGVIPLFLKNTGDPNQSLIQHKDQNVAEVTQQLSNMYRINKLEDNQIGTPNIEFPDGWNYNTLNIAVKPPFNRGGLKGRWFITHLKSTQNDHKIILQLNLSTVLQNFK